MSRNAFFSRLLLPFLTSFGLAAALGCSADAPGSSNAPIGPSPGVTTDAQGNPVASTPVGDGPVPEIIDIVATDEDGACGNGKVDALGENCDDGNNESGDGCSADCGNVELNYSCTPGFKCVYVHVCGDGIQGPGEQCDDANTLPSDGCSEFCFLEAGWACPTPGQACVYVVQCGDGNLGGTEQCDDSNQANGDGCTDACQIEPGWTCSQAGAKCREICGDGAIVGLEDCDDGNTTGGDGCSATCRSEIGFECDAPGTPCRATVCGDGVPEGGEACDDGNNLLGDGCSPGCISEPDCSGTGGCRSSCGDGLILPGDVEECDDGNRKNGDGCSADCKFEPGFVCEEVTSVGGNQLTLPIIYRDFIGVGQATVTNAWDRPVASYLAANGHPDFENITFSHWVGEQANINWYNAKGIVRTELGADGRPVYAGTTADARAQVTSQASFDQWFKDDPSVNRTLLSTLTLIRPNAQSPYEYDSAAFFPLDNLQGTWVASGDERERAVDWDGQGCWNKLLDRHQCGTGCRVDADDGNRANLPHEACTLSENYATCVDQHNFSFTSELRYWFEYQGGEQLTFRGDDDVFVFINRRLVVDLGGLHEPLGADVCGQVWGEVERHPQYWSNPNPDGFARQPQRDTAGLPIAGTPPAVCMGLGPTTTDVEGRSLNLEVGKVYEVALFQAERHTCVSNYRLTLSGFTQRRSECQSNCGDGMLASTEVCDDGPMNGAGYGYCKTDCTPGPRCGDGILDEGHEQCDNGFNGSGYFTQEGDCAPGCVFPPFCGDGNVDGAFGESCDDGILDGSYGGCAFQMCVPGPHCGDGVHDVEHEECDDGNRVNNDGCAVDCKKEPRFESR